MDCSLQGSSLHGILQARILKWVATSFSRGSSQPKDRTLVSCIAGRCFNLWALSWAIWLEFLYFYLNSGHHLNKILWEQGQTLLLLPQGGLVIKSCLTLATPCSVAPQAPLSVGFPRQEYWSGLPCPPPGDLPNPGVELPALWADSIATELQEKPKVPGSQSVTCPATK